VTGCFSHVDVTVVVTRLETHLEQFIMGLMQLIMTASRCWYFYFIAD